MNIQRNLSGNALRVYKAGLTLSTEQQEILIGTLLGDATMRLSGNRPVYAIKFEQGSAHQEYLRHLYDVFQPFCGTPPKSRLVDKKNNRISFTFSTYRHDAFVFYYNLFYEVQEKSEGSVKVKVIRESLAKHLTARSLAYWFMDDGTYSTDENGVTKSYLFSTQGFNYCENQRLCKMLKAKFNIQANVHKDQDKYRIYIIRASNETFLNLIRPYIHSDFKYKL